MMKKLKYFLFILNVVLIILAIFLGFKIYQQKQIAATQERIAKKISDEESRMSKSSSVILQSGMIENNYVSVAYPITETGEKISSVEHELQSYIEETFGVTNASEEIRYLTFIEAVPSDYELNHVIDYSIHVRRFESTKRKIVKLADEEVVKFQIREDNGQLFDLTQLVTDEQFLKDKIISQLELTLEKSNKLDGEAKQNIDSIQEIDLKSLDFDISKGKVSVYLDKVISGEDKVMLALTDLFEKIDSSLLKGADLEDYNAYEEEQKRIAEEEARKAAEANKRPQVVAKGKVVALTFDDGPNPTNTPRVLDILKKYNAKATFFVIGSSVPGNESILKRAVSEGHEIGNHTWSHTSLTSLNGKDIKYQIEETDKAVSKAIGEPTKFVRPPYGATNMTVKNTVGVPQILWDVDTLDWQSHNTQAILTNVQNQVYPGAIILMHDIHGSTADALPTVLDYLVSQGYSFVTISELYGY